MQVDIDHSFLRAREILRGLVPAAEIHHVGSTAIVDLFSRGIVDIELLVDAAQRQEISASVHSCSALHDLPMPIHVHVGELHKPSASVYLRQRFATDPVLVGEFRALQKSFVHRIGKPYPLAKQAFFAELLNEAGDALATEVLPYRIEIDTERMQLVSALACDASAHAAYWTRNRDHLASFASTREETRSEAFWRERLSTEPLAHWRKQGLTLLCYRKSDQQLIGSVGFGAFAWGALRSCGLGYNIDAAAEGQGFMREAVAPAIRYVFERMGVHRITAAYDPSNLRSARLLEHLGFRIEGEAKKYIELADGWHDSVLTALTR